eukprot:SAG31_NODE_964_length_10697_cov_6.821004_3_plen_129_part_00
MPPQRYRDHTPEGLERVTTMMDTDELPFKMEDVKDKIYVLKGRDGKIAIEWNEVSANFNRKQGFGNANKYKREKDESTDDFVARCVQLYIKGKTDYNSGTIFILIFKNNYSHNINLTLGLRKIAAQRM